MPLPKKDVLEDKEKFAAWLSHQTKKCQRKWSNPDKIREWQKKCGRPGKKGEDSPRWVGDNIKYNSLHLILRKQIEKPEGCTHCGKKAERLELANITGQYTRDPTNYIWLCTKCHRKMDGHAYKLMKQKTRHGLFFNQYYQQNAAIITDF